MHLNAKESIVLPAIPDSILKATDFVDRLLDTLNCSAKAHAQLSVIIDEIFSNIVHHARGAYTAEIRFSYDPETHVVELTFLDEGTPYNPLLHKEPDTTLPAEKRAIGGLGIFLVKKLTDRLSYEYSGGKNILHIWKTV